jgi:hypothetical protein
MTPSLPLLELSLRQLRPWLAGAMVAGCIIADAGWPHAAAAGPPADVGVSGLPAASEAAARQFATDHHPELAALLEQLEKTAPAEFEAAIKELDGARRHVEALKALQPIDYELGLAEWRLMSRIRLKLAQMAMADDPKLDEQLRQMVKQLVEIRQQALRSEREFVMRRFDRITAALVEYERDPDLAVERELASLAKSLKNAPQRPPAAAAK